MKELILILLVVAFIVGIIVCVPLLFIWCVNTLFGCGIAYSLLNWFAAFVLMTITSGSSASAKLKS